MILKVSFLFSSFTGLVLGQSSCLDKPCSQSLLSLVLHLSFSHCQRQDKNIGDHFKESCIKAVVSLRNLLCKCQTYFYFLWRLANGLQVTSFS